MNFEHFFRYWYWVCDFQSIFNMDNENLALCDVHMFCLIKLTLQKRGRNCSTQFIQLFSYFLATTNSRLRNILYRTYTHWKLFAINLHYTGNDFWLWFYFISHFWFAIKYTYILFMQWKKREKKSTLIGSNCAFSLNSFSFILLSTKLEREFSPKISHIIHFMIRIQFCGILCV